MHVRIESFSLMAFVFVCHTALITPTDGGVGSSDVLIQINRHLSAKGCLMSLLTGCLD